MGRIKYTLVTEGSSDRLLRYVIDWLLDQLTSIDFDGDWADPKDASELKGRRLRRFRQGQARQRLAELIEDYSPLEQLSAFQAFRSELNSVLVEHGWN
ncbi:MAG: hypothetical protein V3T72_08540 [Thermoanaerobaculia bacterium]